MAALAVVLGLAACASAPPEPAAPELPPEVAGYGLLIDGDYTLPAIPPQYLDPPNRREQVLYAGTETPGTLVVDPFAKFLYLVEEGGTAMRYPIAVGRLGRGFRGSATVGDLREWPGWTPTANMLRTEPEVYGPFRRGVPGGIASPLGARALYLYRGNRDTMFRIHGTNDLGSIGNYSSAGCIRLFNHDIIDLYDRVERGARVKVRTAAESVEMEGPYAARGVELPPTIVSPEELYGAIGLDVPEV
jgi:lipoprotein-anchoring transpeptidase ErfK/SrfK